VEFDRAKKILNDNAEGHNKLAELLIEKEVIFAEDLEKIFGKRPWTSRNDELMAQNGETEGLDEPKPDKPVLTEALPVEKTEDNAE
jgi:cell division protease FtsH